MKQKHVELKEKKPIDGELLSVDIKLQSNAAMMTDVRSKIKMVEAVLIKKESPTCGKECIAKCDAEADKMIRELKNPLHDITKNCKDNFDQYTMDYDPDHEHVDKMTSEVMDVQKVMNKIKLLQSKLDLKNNGLSVEQADLDR